MTTPETIEECRLIDHAGARTHRRERVGLGALEVGAAGDAVRYLDDGFPFRLELLEPLRLVQLAVPRENVELRIVALRTLELASCHRELELRQTLARGEARQVGRAENELVVEQLHRASLPGTPGYRPTVDPG